VGCVIETGVTCRAAQLAKGNANPATATSRMTEQSEKAFENSMTFPTRGVWIDRSFSS
jgi:hypothetical protein